MTKEEMRNEIVSAHNARVNAVLSHQLVSRKGGQADIWGARGKYYSHGAALVRKYHPQVGTSRTNAKSGGYHKFRRYTCSVIHIKSKARRYKKYKQERKKDSPISSSL